VTTVVYYNLSSEFCIGLICSIVTKDQSLRNFKSWKDSPNDAKYFYLL